MVRTTQSTAKADADASAAAPTRRQQLAAKTRERMLKIAIREFAEKGFSGARVETIARRSKLNIRMIYHYFGGKEKLYVEVLEHVLAKLREAELAVSLDEHAVDPVAGIQQLYDFTEEHFSTHPELLSLLSWENLHRARYLKTSKRIPAMSSPVLDKLHTLIRRGETGGTLRRGIDPLHLYVTLVSLAYFHKSNAHTISRMFDTEMLAPAWQAAHKAQAHELVRAFLQSGEMAEVVPVRAVRGR
ncbi:TetR/AcrR family transcriptional regulator [Paraburkholderia caballeronis]|uniref:DNA-binding transcriptional regulator, AcrR family n=1 Tax=Paraburkholderia caballeronis TaxID=416943 RepID=A0A1H7LAC0_9BURK|nr:TetR/AcrR family transcriptional regulator [Paraburkholderia caballeronis]PXW28369.1 TetR family transcriptional regulator [Paraburkholderia caballeronis]PXX03735.1 TetR family transcriptional regulator [Paraburkholderia caballeronis]RAK04479.1 TetR family transcriptional regulator [Paraburkholderia caballeronis]TDV39482.1 TetR family transcriptional regulator [Paraburkholderia caballeronis]SED78512.1 transcriptional regulator, TetR family [Paraburkholderia caballeronis]